MENSACDKEILKQTAHGSLIKCHSCKQYHIEFNNLHFSFDAEDFRFFRKYFAELQPEKWEDVNRTSLYRRKIMVPLSHKNVMALFNSAEVREMKQLLSTKPSKAFQLVNTARFSANISSN